MTGMVQQTLGWGIRTMVQGGYIGSRVSLQTDYPGSYYYVLQVNKSFLKDRFTLSLVASNIFDNERKSKGKKIGAGYVQHFGECHGIFECSVLVVLPDRELTGRGEEGKKRNCE